MNNKWVPYIFVLIAFLIIISLDSFQTAPGQEESKQIKSMPIPKLKLMVAGQPIEYKSGKFDWVDKGTGSIIDEDEPPLLFSNILITTVKPFSVLEPSFSLEPDKIEISTFQSNYDLEDEMFPFTPLSGSTYMFNNTAGQQTTVIRATYGEQEFHYAFPLIIEKTISYQSQLAEEKGKLAILEIFDETQRAANWPLKDVKNTHIHKAQSMSVKNVEEAKAKFPDLEITSLPYYAIFNHEKVLYQLNDSQEFFKLLGVVIP